MRRALSPATEPGTPQVPTSSRLRGILAAGATALLHTALPSAQPALLSSTSPSLLPPCPATNATVLHRPFSSALSAVCCCTLLLAHPVGTTSSAVPSRANAIPPSLTPASGSWSRPRQCLQRVPPPRESTHRLLPVPKKQHICLLPTPTPSAKLTPGKRNKLLLLRGSRGMAEGGRSRGRLQLCLRPGAGSTARGGPGPRLGTQRPPEPSPRLAARGQPGSPMPAGSSAPPRRPTSRSQGWSLRSAPTEPRRENLGIPSQRRLGAGGRKKPRRPGVPLPGRASPAAEGAAGPGPSAPGPPALPSPVSPASALPSTPRSPQAPTHPPRRHRDRAIPLALPEVQPSPAPQPKRDQRSSERQQKQPIRAQGREERRAAEPMGASRTCPGVPHLFLLPCLLRAGTERGCHGRGGLRAPSAPRAPSGAALCSKMAAAAP